MKHSDIVGGSLIVGNVSCVRVAKKSSRIGVMVFRIDLHMLATAGYFSQCLSTNHSSHDP